MSIGTELLLFLRYFFFFLQTAANHTSLQTQPAEQISGMWQCGVGRGSLFEKGLDFLLLVFSLCIRGATVSGR